MEAMERAVTMAIAAIAAAVVVAERAAAGTNHTYAALLTLPSFMRSMSAAVGVGYPSSSTLPLSSQCG